MTFKMLISHAGTILHMRHYDTASACTDAMDKAITHFRGTSQEVVIAMLDKNDCLITEIKIENE